MKICIDIDDSSIKTETKPKKKLYWRKTITNSGSAYHLQCPKCNHLFVMPKQWGVWKGCPVCWTELSYRKEQK